MIMVIATYYILFAVIGSSWPTWAWESLVAGAFFVFAVVGFMKNLWLIVIALAGHGIFDVFHHLLIQNPGVPTWWTGFCLSFDVFASGFLAVLLIKRSPRLSSSVLQPYGFGPSNYSLIFNNCQDHSEAVRENFRREKLGLPTD